MNNSKRAMSKKAVIEPSGLLSGVNRETRPATKRMYSKASAIGRECVLGMTQMQKLTSSLKSQPNLVETLVIRAMFNAVYSEHKEKIKHIQQIPHWCFRKNRPELEPRLYNRWLKSQAKAGAMVVTGK